MEQEEEALHASRMGELQWVKQFDSTLEIAALHGHQEIFDLIYPVCIQAAETDGFGSVLLLLIVTDCTNAVKTLITNGKIPENLVEIWFDNAEKIGKTAMMKLFLDTGCVSLATLNQAFERAVTTNPRKSESSERRAHRETSQGSGHAVILKRICQQQHLTHDDIATALEFFFTFLSATTANKLRSEF
ncbi:hypothetical protein P3T76_015211 [Phytophthora citrophthora]|uniref:Uncharacterized protein n=1 Tax=Phytophthora citrophthora TaxID=4793 RepID=A0AAD9LBK5_9STRA|nr:hypothetical protein P3T76_015211 [Phytophthora citrophthora]